MPSTLLDSIFNDKILLAISAISITFLSSKAVPEGESTF
jgi:hypothetical protein